MHDQALIADRVSAQLSRDSLRIYWPTGLHVGLRAVATGMLSVQQASGRPMPGSYGMISATDASGGGHSVPVFTFAPGISRWNIDGLFADNGSLPSNWVKVEMPNSQITVSGIPWSRLNAGNLANCGNGQRTDPDATDHAGLITEGAGAAGCIIKFSTPYPIPPHCFVSSPTGTPLSYAIDAAEIRVANTRAPHTEISYVCTLEF